MAQAYGDGTIKTASGRETYTADGLSPDFRPRSPLPGAAERQVRGHQGLGQGGETGSLSGSTRGPSETSSLGDLGDDKEDPTNQGSRQDNPNDEIPHGRLDERGTFPSYLVAGLNEENFSPEADVEKQNDRNHRNLYDKDEKDPNLVDWDGPDDTGNPQNFPEWKKWVITATTGIMTFTVTFASSVFSTATRVTAEQFNVSPEVMVLGTSLFVLGFAFGPIVWGPFSELYGRKIPLFTGFFIFAIFQIPVAVAQNLQTIFVCRFFGGFFASAPLAIVGGLLADMHNPVNRGIAITVFAGATFIGPVAGPIVGGFLTMSYLGWRWTAWLTCILAFSFGLIGFVIIPETFGGVLLQKRAKEIRYATRNWAIHSKLDENEVNLTEIANKYLLRPFHMLILEPILVLITIYMAFIYGFLYLCFEAYPIAFQQERGWNDGVGALPFLSILVGIMIGCVIIIVFTKTRFAAKMKANGGKPIPEERLLPMIIGGFFLPIGMFWFAWTSNPHITWVPQVISGGFIGAGVLLIFLQGLNYIIDCYMMNANSAIAANTFFRSWIGAGFPLFATGMFHNLGVPWAMSLLGFLTAALFPVPILFFFYGARIRKLSKFSPNM